MLKVADNPTPRWPEGRPLAEDIGAWWVARVRSRNEKALASELAVLGIPYYLPMMAQRRARKDNGKSRKSLVCMFPGYVPVVGYPRHKREILRSGRVLNVLPVPDQCRFVRELDAVRSALALDGSLRLHPHVVAGQRAVVNSGPMKGVEGVVLDSAPRGMLFLNIDVFQRAVVLTLPAEQVSLADGPAHKASGGT